MMMFQYFSLDIQTKLHRRIGSNRFSYYGVKYYNFVRQCPGSVDLWREKKKKRNKRNISFGGILSLKTTYRELLT